MNPIRWIWRHWTRAEILEALGRIERKADRNTMDIAEAVRLLEEANVQTDDIAADIESLLATRTDVPPEVASRLTAHVERLRGVASQVVTESEDPAAPDDGAGEPTDTGGETPPTDDGSEGAAPI